MIATEEDIEGALTDHATDVRAAIHDDDIAALYVPVSEPLRERAVLTVSSLDAEREHSFRASTPVSAARSLGEAEGELEKQNRSGYLTVVSFERWGEAERARYSLDRISPRMLKPSEPDKPLAPDPSVYFAEGSVQEGFIAPALKLAVIPVRKLVHRRRAETPAPTRGRLAAIGDLSVGEFVVHEDHGVARFTGFDTRTVAGITRDYLDLSYRDGDKVLVPAEQLAKITRYVGAGDHEPELSKLGGKRWTNLKTRARRAAREMAGELLNLYAERQARKGHMFSPDGEWQLRLEESFPYRETADQLEAIEAVKADMESERPMDRLICGDVGYGKTEVAIRAAQKALSDSKQVMVLVPTTILATQHLGTFRERMRDFPYEIEMVSRLRKPAEVKEALAKFATGELDVLIGTHRLLSRDVRAKDLGLMVIDEEQRFGVKQKELLRQFKLKVDVLSMSATPIPRTMQMSLAGIRDISVIETPPEGRRPVRTYVGPYDEELVRTAIERELQRDGQAFFLHNRVDTLHETAERLRALVPKARFLEAHGQLDEGELETTMLSFMRGEADVLVATTIIESGLDVPGREHADRRARRPPRPRAGVPDPRPRRPLSRARPRLHALSLGGGRHPGGGPAAGDALRPHRARLRLPDRDARPRVARRRRPARLRAVGPRRGDRLRALRRDARRGGRGAARGRWRRALRLRGSRRRRRLRLRPLRLHPLRGGEDRRPPPHRWSPPPGRAPRARR